MSAKEFALRLKAARTARGLTQKQLAAAVGTVQPEIAGMESGKRVVSLSTAVKLADALYVTLDWLAAHRPGRPRRSTAAAPGVGGVRRRSHDARTLVNQRSIRAEVL